MSPSSSALESIPSSTSTGAVEIKWVFRVNLWATSFKGIFLEKYPQFSKKNFLSEICRRSQFFVWVGTGRRNLKVATCLNNFLAGISTSAHCTGSYIFFSKIVQKKGKTSFFLFNQAPLEKSCSLAPAHIDQLIWALIIGRYRSDIAISVICRSNNWPIPIDWVIGKLVIP